MAEAQRILLLVEPGTSYGRNVLRGVARFARVRKSWIFDYELLTDIDHLISRGLAQADGIIIRGAEQKWVEAVLASGIKAVNVSSERGRLELPTVISDNPAIGRMAASHLISRGFKAFACCGLAEKANFQDRMSAFAREVEQQGFACHRMPAELQPKEALLTASDAKSLREWLAGLPRPIGLMAANDEFGRLVAQACRGLGIRVPEDVAVIGVDNDEVICELSNPPLSSVDHGAERIGYLAAKLLNKLLSGSKAPARPLLVKPVGVVARRSTDTLAVDDPVVSEAMRYAWENVQRGVDVEELARHVKTSRRWLEVRFRRVLGRAPAAEIRRAQVEQAKKLLAETDLLMPDVAAASGFTDAKLLIAVFRREVGVTPTAYRKEYRLT